MNIPEPQEHQAYEAFEGMFRAEVCQGCGALVGDTLQHDQDHYGWGLLTQRIMQILDALVDDQVRKP